MLKSETFFVKVGDYIKIDWRHKMVYPKSKMLKGIIENLNLVYVEVDGASYDKILGLFKNGVMFEPSTPREFFYLASYCEHVMDNKEVAFRNYCRVR